MLAELREHGRLTEATGARSRSRRSPRTAAYDAAIVEWLRTARRSPQHLIVPLAHREVLRYGENPHQHGARYRKVGTTSWWDGVEQHSGVALSYLNLYDTEAAWKLAHDLGDRAVCAIIKHANPCGVAVAGDLVTAYERGARRATSARRSAGSWRSTARSTTPPPRAMASGPQADVVIAPGYEGAAIETLRAKRKNTRLLEAPAPTADAREFRQISGGFLVQDAAHFAAGRDDWRVVTEGRPDRRAVADAELAWRVCGYVKSTRSCSSGTVRPSGSARVSRTGSSRARSRRRRLPAGRRAARARRTRSTRSPTASRRRRRPASRSWSSRAVRSATRRSSPGPTSSGLAMVFTGERHFLH